MTETTGRLLRLFAEDPDRARCFSAAAQGFYLDYSKQLLDRAGRDSLFELARARAVEAERDRLFAGERVNVTENRAALHMALRAPREAVMRVDGVNVIPEVHAVLEKMRVFAEALRSGAWRGSTGEPITDVVNLGIGGSDLGPRMVCEALREDCDGPRVHFVANVDPAQILGVLRELDARRTLFIVTSKTFTTLETLANARLARDWWAKGCPGGELARHFVAVSTNAEAVAAFGIPASQMFGFWDWVGGRYSLWSAVGLSAMIALGPERFAQLLAGAHAMDTHFARAPLEQNLPVLLALLTYHNVNRLGFTSQVVIPYAQRLAWFVPWLQQLEMESNGKGVDRQGRPLAGPSTPPLWGDVGTNGQHAFFQMLHQGTAVHPVDFIVPVRARAGTPEQHRLLLANALAQGAALMRGKTAEAVRAELSTQGLTGEALDAAVPHRVFPGDRPSSTLLVEQLDAWHLGGLLALYEHRTFVLSVLWNVYAFDQWGVELGKQIARTVDAALVSGDVGALDPSTQALVREIRSRAGAP